MLLLTTLAAAGVRRGAWATRVVVALVLGVLVTLVVAVVVAAPPPDAMPGLPPGATPLGVAQGAGILFFAFAGYARIATLGEEVRDPGRNIPRAIGIALGLVLVVYAAVGAALIGALGTARLATSDRPLAELAEVLGGQIGRAHV